MPVEADRVAHRHRVQFDEDQPELLDRAQAAVAPAVGDESDRLGLPFGVVPADQVFE
jgi:hypothetical protein